MSSLTTTEKLDQPPPVLRGWLIAIFILLIFSTGINAAAAYVTIVGIDASDDSLLSLIQNGSFKGVSLAVTLVLAFELLSPLTMVAYLLYLLRLFFKKSRYFPFAYLGTAPLTLAIFLLIALAHYLVGLQIQSPEEGAFSIVGALVGYQYLITNSRPRKTFVL